MLKKISQSLCLMALASTMLFSCNDKNASEKTTQSEENLNSGEENLEKKLSGLQKASEEGMDKIEEEITIQQEEEGSAYVFPQTDSLVATLEDEELLSEEEEEDLAIDKKKELEEEEITANQEEELEE